MGQKKPYNPNTAYGRRKLREQAAQNYANMTPQQQQKHDTTKFWVTLIILIVVGGLIFLTGGSGALTKWLSR